MKTLRYITLVSFLAFVLFGCGGGESSTNTQSSTKQVIVERGPLLGATVTDANGAIASQVENTNKYLFENLPIFPIKATGGFVDMDDSGALSVGDLPFEDRVLLSFTDVVTPITTYLATLSDSKRVIYLNILEETFNVDNIATTLPSQNSVSAVILANAIFEDSLDGEYELENIIKSFALYKSLVESKYSQENNLVILSNKLEKELIENNPLLVVTEILP